MTANLIWMFLLAGGDVPRLSLQDEPQPPKEVEGVRRGMGPYGRGYWGHFGGSIFSEEGQVQGTRLSLDDDLGLDAPTGAWEIGMRREVWYPHSNSHAVFNAAFLVLDGSEEETLSSSETYNSRTFSAGERLESRLQANLLMFSVDLGFVSGIVDPEVTEVEERSYEVGMTFGAGFEWAKATIRSETTGVDTDEGFGHAVVGFGLFAWVEPLEGFRLGGRTGAYIDLLGIFSIYTDATVADSALSLEIQPADFLSIELGYRFLWSSFNLGEEQELYGNDRDFRFTYSWSAVYLGVHVKF